MGVKFKVFEDKVVRIDYSYERVLFLLSMGWKPDRIGLSMGLSARTIEAIIETMKNQLKCSNTTALIAKCIREEVIY